MSDKGHRAVFAIPTHTATIRSGSATSSVGHQPAEIQVREGKVKQNKKNLRMPTDLQLKDWLENVYGKAGYTKGLMCEFILLTALRREEVACVRIDTLPEDPADWHRSKSDAPLEEQRVRVSIKFGTKGPCYGYDHGDKIGPERSIWMPLVLAERIHEYRKKKRNAALRLWVNGAANLQEKKTRIANTVHLFLDEKTGKRLNDKSLYNAWTSVELPYKGWSPHLGRDWWACTVLWNEMKKHEHLAKLDISTAAALLESTAMSIIRLQIQPQLGHAHGATTMIYLEWIVNMLGVNVAIELERADDSAHSQDEGNIY
jgi:integrase